MIHKYLFGYYISYYSHVKILCNLYKCSEDHPISLLQASPASRCDQGSERTSGFKLWVGTVRKDRLVRQLGSPVNVQPTHGRRRRGVRSLGPGECERLRCRPVRPRSGSRSVSERIHLHLLSSPLSTGSDQARR